jgi:hypothetical protein
MHPGSLDRRRSARGSRPFAPSTCDEDTHTHTYAYACICMICHPRRFGPPHPLVQPTGATHWCNPLVQPTGATHWCNPLVQPTGATHWRRLLPTPEDARCCSGLPRASASLISPSAAWAALAWPCGRLSTWASTRGQHAPATASPLCLPRSGWRCRPRGTRPSPACGARLASTCLRARLRATSTNGRTTLTLSSGDCVGLFRESAIACLRETVSFCLSMLYRLSTSTSCLRLHAQRRRIRYRRPWARRLSLLGLGAATAASP